MGRKPIISRESAVQTALAIIDSDGLDGLSLERIANALGVRAPSLYHHFKDKAEILVEVARLVFSEIDLAQRTDDWAQYIIDIGLSFHATVLRHPNAATILIESMPDWIATPTFDRGARAMEAAGVEPSLQLIILEGSEKLTWGATIRQAMRLRNGGREMPSETVEDRFPALARARRSSRWNDEQMLEAALRAFIQGVLRTDEPAVRRRTPRRPRPPAPAPERASGHRTSAKRN